MKLPPLNALRAFDAAGRHQSFLLAAKELHVSAASVSRFIKVLEGDLGQILFTRHANGVRLTEMGEQYLLAIQPALQQIASISHDFRQDNTKRRLNIVSIPAIAETWLVSRLWNFQQQHKNIQINLVLDDQMVNLRASEATIWLNYSYGKYEGAKSFALPQDRLTLVCTPEIAQTLKTPSDILDYPLLVDIDWQADWHAWLAAARLTDAETQLTSNHIEFERYSMVINAALAGSGVAIGHTALLDSYLNMGTLVAPFTINATSEKQFYAVVSANTQRRSVKQFVNWFVGQDYFAV